MLEVREVVRQWLAGEPKKRIAARLGLDPKTTRRYIAAAIEAGVVPSGGLEGLTEERMAAIWAALRTPPERPKGDAWRLCEIHRQFIADKLQDGVRLSKTRRLLQRYGVMVPYSTLHRFAVEELNFGRRSPTVPVADGEPGRELQVDTGWVGWVEDGPRRRLRAWIFTPHVSRYRFVYPCFQESTATAIEACEAAWAFYGGVFRVLVPDNTKAIVQQADPLDARITPAFLEYAQARGFHIDPARSRHPKDKPRVERAVRDTRDDCFGGEHLTSLPEARAHALRWYAEEYGMRAHSSTRRMPREHFEALERPELLPAPAVPYDVPEYFEPKVAPDHFAQVARALYSVPTRFIGERLVARADRTTVRFYHRGEIVKTHARVGPGERSVDANDFPSDRTPYAMRDVRFLAEQADQCGTHVGLYARALLQGPLPWTRMRQVRALLGLARKYGEARLETTCAMALQADLVDVRRLERMLQAVATPPGPTPTQNVIPFARYLRPTEQYAVSPKGQRKGGQDHE